MTWADRQVQLRHPSGRVRCEQGWGRSRVVSESLRDQELWFVWAGRGWMQTHRGRFELRPGFAVWMRPGGVYDAGQDDRDPLGVTYIHFDLLNAARQPVDERSLRRLPAFFHVPDVTTIDILTQRIIELLPPPGRPVPAYPSGGAGPMLLGLLIDLCERRGSRQPPKPSEHHWQAAVCELARRMADQPAAMPSVQAMAKTMRMSRTHFSRCFQHVTGQSPQRYLIHARVGKAQHLLRESTRSVGQIAQALGYRDVYFFSRQFKQFTGQSPMEYRRGCCPRA